MVAMTCFSALAVDGQTIKKEDILWASKRGEELDKLLNSATKFPVYYKVGEVPAEQPIVIMMLRQKVSKHWRVRDVATNGHSWELTPIKSQGI